MLASRLLNIKTQPVDWHVLKLLFESSIEVWRHIIIVDWKWRIPILPAEMKQKQTSQSWILINVSMLTNSVYLLSTSWSNPGEQINKIHVDTCWIIVLLHMSELHRQFFFSWAFNDYQLKRVLIVKAMNWSIAFSGGWDRYPSYCFWISRTCFTRR